MSLNQVNVLVHLHLIESCMSLRVIPLPTARRMRIKRLTPVQYVPVVFTNSLQLQLSAQWAAKTEPPTGVRVQKNVLLEVDLCDCCCGRFGGLR